MIWPLDLVPFAWSKSLVLPMEITQPANLRILHDAATLAGADLLDDVLYMIQATPRHTYELLTEYPAKLLDWMKENDTRWQLVQRLTAVSWGVKVKTQEEATWMIPQAISWPVRYRWVEAFEGVNLSLWLPHGFSTIGHSGVCEDCSRGRAENHMHLPSAPSYFRKVAFAA